MVDQTYLAFISYRHADNKEQGRQWASWLHERLETYQIPQSLVDTENEAGDLIPQRIFPVFRDEAELPADGNLSGAIKRALDASSLLIVMCSPQAVGSAYVAEEIEYFGKIGRAHRVLGVIIDGEPNASIDKQKQANGFISSEECFPKPMQFVYDQDGCTAERQDEPIAADFRIHIRGKAFQAWTDKASVKTWLDHQFDIPRKEKKQLLVNYMAKQELMFLKVAAGVLGISLGLLKKRDEHYQAELRRKQTKLRSRWLGVVAAMSLAAIIFGWLAYLNEGRAERLAERVLMSQSEFLLNEIDPAIEAKDYDLALLLGLNAVPGVYGGERPSPANLAALTGAISLHHRGETVYSKVDEVRRELVNGGKQVASFIVGEESIAFSDSETGSLTQELEIGLPVSRVWTVNEKVVIAGTERHLILIEQSQGRWQKGGSLKVAGKIEHSASLAVGADRKLALVSYVNDTARLQVWRDWVDALQEGQDQSALFNHSLGSDSWWATEFSPDSIYLLLSSRDGALSAYSFERQSLDALIEADDDIRLNVLNRVFFTGKHTLGAYGNSSRKSYQTIKFDLRDQSKSAYEGWFLPDNYTKPDHLLVVAPRGRFASWATLSNESEKRILKGFIKGLGRFSDGKYFYVVTKESWAIWGSQTGKLLHYAKHHLDDLQSIEIRDTRLYMRGDGIIRWWDLDTVQAALHTPLHDDVIIERHEGMKEYEIRALENDNADNMYERASLSELEAIALKLLPSNRRCMTSTERIKYKLAELSVEQRKERNCQY